MPAPKKNKYWMLAQMTGRPPHYENREQMQEKILEYFNKCYKRGKCHATITGLILYLGFESRSTFYAYEEKEEFSYIIKCARMFVENCYENQLYSDRPSGAIFALNQMGWKQKTESETSVKMQVLKAEVEIVDAGVPLATSEKDISEE